MKFFFFLFSLKDLMTHRKGICFSPLLNCYFYFLTIVKVFVLFLLQILSATSRTLFNNDGIFEFYLALFLSLKLYFLPLKNNGGSFLQLVSESFQFLGFKALIILNLFFLIVLIRRLYLFF